MNKSFLTAGGLLLLLFLLWLAFPARQDPLTEKIDTANREAKTWLFNNLRGKGLFVYAYNPVTKEYSSKNNAIRQLMASRVLADGPVLDPGVGGDLAGVDDLDFLFANWYETEQGRGYVYYDDKSKLGANAMLLRTLIASPLYSEYEQKAEELYRGILHLQNQNGSFNAWYREPGYTYDEDYLLTFYSGEAIVAMAEYYQKTQDPQVLKAALKSQDYYVRKYVEKLEQNYYPAYVPWHTMSLNKLYKITENGEYAEAAFTLNDKLLELQDGERFIGRFYNPDTPQYGSPHTSSDAVYTEGLAYTYELAKLTNDMERQRIYREAIELAIDNLISLQYKDPRDTSHIFSGSFKVRIDSSWNRVDATQHAIDAFNKLLQVL